MARTTNAVLVLLIVLGLCSLAQAGQVIYVDTDATGTDDGSSWENAFSTSFGLQVALGDAEDGDEIRVAMGTYKPDITNGIIPPSLSASFELKNGVAIKGGYAGVNGAPIPGARDIELYETILSGDLNGDDTVVVEAVHMQYDTSREDNSYRVVKNNDIDSSAVLDGFTITGGHSGQHNGCGMVNYNSSPTINNCTFKWNFSEDGGGMYNYSNSNPTLSNCKFINNYGLGRGGGVLNNNSNPTLINCIFIGNMTGQDGGGISGSSTLINCVFSGNIAGNYGGGVHGDSTVTNCILWGNSDSGDGNSQISGDLSLMTYSCVQQDLPGNENGNINVNPLFVDPDGPDGIVGTEDDDLRLQPGSPCINAGDNSVVTTATDMDGNERIVNTYVDMGAYESQGMPLIYFVDDDATGTDDGSSWENAYTSLPYALNTASYGYEIRVAQGTYRPNDGVITIGDERELTFQLKNRVAVKGGYAGFGEADPDARDVELYETILSGDLYGDDIAVTDPADMANDMNREFNSYHVVSGFQIDDTAILDGFTISGGNATDGSDYYGGGMANDDGSSPTINNCKFVWNMAIYGGGMDNIYNSNPTLNNCIFSNNYSQTSGGMSNYYSSPMLTDCTFSGNLTYGPGGGISNIFASPTITNCRFINNAAYGSGGAMDNGANGNPIVTNCLFVGNSVDSVDPNWGKGGAVYSSLSGSSNPVYANCTFYGNSAQYGGAIYCAEGDIALIINNCILWGNSAANGPEIAMTTAGIGSSLDVSYSTVQGGEDAIYDKSALSWDNMSNIDFDPGFVDPNGTDGIAGTADDDLRLSSDSLCIDSGDNSVVTVTTDLDGNVRIANNFVDMGAYEFSGTHTIYVDDDAVGNPGGNNGTAAYPFATTQEAIQIAKDGNKVIVMPGTYVEPEISIPEIPIAVAYIDKNITLTSFDPNDWQIVENTVLSGRVVFSGTEDPTCKLTGFKIQNTFTGSIVGNGTHATISNCIISGNGPCTAMVINDCDGLITNCLITDNTTFALCGVYPVVFGCNGLIRNCTIANNDSPIGDSDGGSITLENCIVYNNGTGGEPQIGISGGGSLDVSYCNIQGGSQGVNSDGIVNWGWGNIDIDPGFVRWGLWDYDALELAEGNYHLQSYGWRLSEYDPGWSYDLDFTSRCIDAGNPGTPLANELMSVPRDLDNYFGINLRVNMGAYGGTDEASMAPHDWAFLGDLSNDGIVDHVDLAGQAEEWLTSGDQQPGDLNRDGIINIKDFAALAKDWLEVTDWNE